MKNLTPIKSIKDFHITQKPAQVWYLRRYIDENEQFTNYKDLNFRRQSSIDLVDYRIFYHAIGGEWKWANRLIINYSELDKLLSEESREVYYVYESNVRIGYFELDLSKVEVELVYFGLLKPYLSKGYGKKMMNYILKRLQTIKQQTIILHTCSNDSPEALDFYQKMKFVIYDNRTENQVIIT
jgi:GNAT superfamily N-acetyltransferase